ncbi:hypothetical protein D4764_04G0001890 [Takifugu flavidus]|uniref:Uncharacterized protein n=1 Tax=Takifugu flavidus TaxID=433684 RepID=A0A5C6N224_9TELE|nr:hypothetical protein D4764_04G0001890 [Takifugu flavidus]
MCPRQKGFLCPRAMQLWGLGTLPCPLLQSSLNGQNTTLHGEKEAEVGWMDDEKHVPIRSYHTPSLFTGTTPTHSLKPGINAEPWREQESLPPVRPIHAPSLKVHLAGSPPSPEVCSMSFEYYKREATGPTLAEHKLILLQACKYVPVLPELVRLAIRCSAGGLVTPCHCPPSGCSSTLPSVTLGALTRFSHIPSFFTVDGEHHFVLLKEREEDLP